LLPPSSDPASLLRAVDGLIFSGGGDIDPEQYNGTLHPTIYGIDPERDAFELALAKLVLKTPLPVLGICRGMQVLSVASGAALIPHLPEVYGDKICHRFDQPRRPTEHNILVQPSSQLSAIFSDAAEAAGPREMPIVSWHHQGIQIAPTDWQIAATATDGLIEAIEHRHHPWLIAVQWHPELSPLGSEQPRLFQALVAAAISATMPV
jgi:putative glutamine amidotransferase